MRPRSCSSALLRQCSFSCTQALASVGFLHSTVSEILGGPLTLPRVQAILQRNLFQRTPSPIISSSEPGKSGNGSARSAQTQAPSPAQQDGPWLIVGLGNPGSKYDGTRHNVGFEVLDALAEAEGVPLSSVQCKAAVGKGRICGMPVLLAKPQTYMNLSGESVGPLAKFYKIPPARVLVVYDDLDLEVAAMKILAKGGHGGHNGMRSIIDRFGGDKSFPRLRFGVGRPTGRTDTKTYVLQRFTKSEREEVDIAIFRGVEGIRSVLSQGLDRTVSQWNQPKRTPVKV